MKGILILITIVLFSQLSIAQRLELFSSYSQYYIVEYGETTTIKNKAKWYYLKNKQGNVESMRFVDIGTMKTFDYKLVDIEEKEDKYIMRFENDMVLVVAESYIGLTHRERSQELTFLFRIRDKINK
ncbi:hypothetical protein [Reichenbachiella sp.]|uniref:hypothetical protein n=1 Tax=Reichenbachiella sp. TaxID=2184521 RepID=UPI003B5B1968